MLAPDSTKMPTSPPTPVDRYTVTHRVLSWCVVASPFAVDSFADASSGADSILIRIAADELVVVCLDGVPPTQTSLGALMVADEHAIVTSDRSLALFSFTKPQFETSVAPLIDWHWTWPSPSVPSALYQGLVANVPVKLVLSAEGATMACSMACSMTHLHELEGRLL